MTKVNDDVRQLMGRDKVVGDIKEIQCKAMLARDSIGRIL